MLWDATLAFVEIDLLRQHSRDIEEGSGCLAQYL